MTGALDDELRELAVELTNEFGKTVTIVRETQTFDPATGSNTTSTQTTQTVATPPADFTTSNLDGTLLQQGDTVIDVPAKGLDLGDPDGPQKSDSVRLDGVTWQIVQVGRVYSGEQVALWRLQLRK